MSLAPGDFLTPVKAQRDVPAELIRAIEIEFGLDRPWYVQYWKWLGNVVQGNLGHSWAYKMPVIDLIGQRLWATFLLSMSAFVFAWGIAIPLGVFLGELSSKYTGEKVTSMTFITDVRAVLAALLPRLRGS